MRQFRVGVWDSRGVAGPRPPPEATSLQSVPSTSPQGGGWAICWLRLLHALTSAAAQSSMLVDLFDFDLPPERIALRPASPRDAARLLVVRPPSAFDDRVVRDLPALLRAG